MKRKGSSKGFSPSTETISSHRDQDSWDKNVDVFGHSDDYSV